MRSSRKCVLITGATGYLGGRLTEHLLRDGWLIRVGSRRPLSDLNEKFGDCVECVRYDISDDGQDLAEAVADCESVVHLSGMNAGDCAKDSQLAHATNVGGTEKLVRACVEAGVCRFLYASTIHVFGSPLVGVLDEQTQVRPTHPYGQSNADAEAAVLNRVGEISTTVVRLSNAFGPPLFGNASCWKLLVNDLCWQAVCNNEIELRTSGEQKRDFIPVTAVTTGIAHLLSQPTDSIGGVFHLGSGRAISVLQIASLIAERCEILLGIKPLVKTGKAKEPESDFTFQSNRIHDYGYLPNQTPETEIDLCLKYVCTSHNRETSLRGESL